MGEDHRVALMLQAIDLGEQVEAFERWCLNRHR